MKYLYYPGCSLEGTATEYNVSSRAFMEAMGAELIELDDWTCCGASAVESVSRLLSLALPARNLAIAEKMGIADEILVPCSACYLNLKKVEQKLVREPQTLEQLNEILAENELSLEGRIRVRHLLDVLSRDIDPADITARLQRSLEGLVIAPYYGCQCLRPFAAFDDPETPRSMEALIRATGAAVHPWDMGGRCCGASHMNTKMAVGLELVGGILKAARGADAVVTVCPMCQMNLEAYQRKISKTNATALDVTILYLPQLLGLAIGLTQQELRLDMNLAVTRAFRQKIEAATVSA